MSVYCPFTANFALRKVQFILIPSENKLILYFPQLIQNPVIKYPASTLYNFNQ